MTDKITLATISNPQNLTSLAAQLNSNFSVIQTAFDNTLSLNPALNNPGTSNQMQTNLDMNSNQILNLPAPGGPNSPARLQDILSTVSVNVPPTGTSGSVMGLLNTNNTYSGNDTFSGNNTFSGTNTFTNTVTLPTGSVTSSEIANNAVGTSQLATNNVTNTVLAQAPAYTLKGNNTSSTANVTDLTAAQVTAMIGIWGNNNQVKTSGYTVVAGDNGSTFSLQGSAFFTLSLNAPNTYLSNFVIKIVNNDTRGKRISPSGINSFILWPGQNVFVYNCNNTWVVENIGRWQKLGATLYVDTANGLDSNDGLAPSTGAFKTIGAAVLAIYQQIDCQNSYPTINIAAGTYTESVVLSGQFVGYNFILFQGAGSSLVTWKPASNFCLLIGDNAECQVAGIKFDGTGTTNCVAISMHQPSVIDVLTDINFGNFPGTTSAHISNDKGGYVNLPSNYTISGNVANHILVGSGCIIFQPGGGSITILNGVTVTTLYSLTGLCELNLAGTVYFNNLGTVTTSYILQGGCIFFKGSNTVPGTAGGVANGSYVI